MQSGPVGSPVALLRIACVAAPDSVNSRLSSSRFRPNRLVNALVRTPIAPEPCGSRRLVSPNGSQREQVRELLRLNVEEGVPIGRSILGVGTVLSRGTR